MCLTQGPQRSDAGEARTRGPSVSSQALYHWATALPIQPLKNWVQLKSHWNENLSLPGPEVIKIILCSTQLSLKIQLLIKNKCWKITTFLAFNLTHVAFIMLINVKMPTIVGILTFMSMINFMLSWVEHEKSFITSGPGLLMTDSYHD